MNHRPALVAYEQSNGRYDVHRSAIIGSDLQLASRITAERPYGHGSSDYTTTIVEETPFAEYRTFQQVINRLDFSRFGALVEVTDAFEKTPYRAVWFGLGDSCRTVSECDSDAYGNGALIAVRDQDVNCQSVADAALCARYRATKRTLGRLIDDGVITAPTARERLRERVAADGETDREVRFATGQEPDTESSSLAELAATGRHLFGRQ